MDLRQPIIVIGTGRSGSTVFQEILSNHSHLAWLSHLCDKYPTKPERNRLLLKALDLPILNRLLRRKYVPNECYVFWEHHCNGFSMPCRDLVPADASERSKRRIRAALSRTLTKHRDRLLLKVTGWPRLGYLGAMFPDAKFIHVLRDGRAVANSLMNIDFWWGWRGPENWRWGRLSPAYEEEWNRRDRSFVALAAIQWKILMDATEKGKQYVADHNFLELRYENICEDPIAAFKTAVEFCDIEWTRDFERRLGRYTLRNTNSKWQRDLNDAQQRDLNAVLEDHLRRYGYL